MLMWDCFLCNLDDMLSEELNITALVKGQTLVMYNSFIVCSWGFLTPLTLGIPTPNKVLYIDQINIYKESRL